MAIVGSVYLFLFKKQTDNLFKNETNLNISPDKSKYEPLFSNKNRKFWASKFSFQSIQDNINALQSVIQYIVTCYLLPNQNLFLIK